MPHTENALRTRELPSLTEPVDPARFVEATGERIALLGHEDGPFECWFWPYKVLSGLRFGLWRAGKLLEFPERTVTVLPGELVLVWKRAGMQLRTEIFACRERPGLALGFALDSDTPLELEVSFRCDLRPMWPAGLGGQLARIEPVTGAFALTEELGRLAVLVGANDARIEFEGADHALPAGEVRLFIPLAAGGSSTVLAIAATELAPDPHAEGARRGQGLSATGYARAARAITETRELWWRLVSDFSEEREAVRAHWRAHQERALAIETPYPALDQAFQWAQVAIERAWVRVEGLGRGLVAGLGPSGSGERPGQGWFFDGDALTASRALSASGDFQAVRAVLRFAASHQRPDGKLMHELTLSANLCSWLEAYPYAYCKGAHSADFVAALDLYLRHSGDLEFVRELMPAAKRAMEWCARSLDSEGRLASTSAGIAAVEAGPLSEVLENEIFLQGAWIAALGSAEFLCAAVGEDSAPYRALAERARAAFEAYWSEERGHYGFAQLRGGKRCDDLTAYLGSPLARGLGERERAWASVQALNEPRLMSDWGARRFASDSPLYDPEHHDHGAVLPYLTNFVTQALFAHGHAFAAHQVLFSQVVLSHFGGLSFLQERLEGTHARIPKHAVPHQISSSAALIESVCLGLFGIEASASEGRVAFRPSLPPHWNEARLAGLLVGEARLDVRLYRCREPGVTRIGLELEKGVGNSLSIGFAPVLPPLTKLLDGPGWLRQSAAVVPRRLHRSDGDPLRLEARVLEGPSVLLPYGLPEDGGESTATRLVAQHLEGDGLRWAFAGRAGTSVALPFFCDFEVDAQGARLFNGELQLDFPPALDEPTKDGGLWTRVEVGIHPR